jgi:hypothetical protein
MQSSSLSSELRGQQRSLSAEDGCDQETEPEALRDHVTQEEKEPLLAHMLLGTEWTEGPSPG